MRKIKFRMWSPKMKKYWPIEQTMNCLAQQVIGTFDHTGLYGDIFEQFTGLLDKNGKEIFEGDIVARYIKTPWMDGANKFVGFVAYKAPCFWLIEDNDKKGGFESYDYHSYEVIGNIHDNPELIDGTR